MTDKDAYSGMPRWVKVLGVIALVILLSFVILMIFGGSEHGPRRHMRATAGADLHR